MSIEDKAQEYEAAQWDILNTGRLSPMDLDATDKACGPIACRDCDEQMPPERRALTADMHPMSDLI